MGELKKVLYIMGIEWNWIFQRPQIFAQQLEQDYELTVVCPKQFIHGKQQNNKLPRQLIELPQLPFQEKNKLVGWVANKIHRHKLGDLSCYDIIWVGYPLFGRYIPKDYKGTVLYDCMDNFEALYPDQRPGAIKEVMEAEKQLLHRADIVLVSSQKLKEKMLTMCPGKEIDVVRNGYSSKINVCPVGQATEKDVYTLGYIGTIAEWFDNEVVEASIASVPKIRYELIGPIAKHQQIKDQAVNYSGVIEHAKLGDRVAKIDCLIMPFIVNDIILYVDPVKLYEYIAWGKCIVASWYPEIDRFQDFVYFYHDKQEYVELLRDLVKRGFPPKYSEAQQKAFLKENTWDERVVAVKAKLK